MSLKTSNQFDTLVNDYSHQHENKQLVERLQEKYKEKPLHVRLKTTRSATLAYSYLANSVSFLTGFFLISYFLSNGLSNHIGKFTSILIASIVGLLAMSFIEYLKRSSNDSFYISVFRYKAFKILPFIGILVTTGASVALSYYGGLEIPSTTNTPPKLKEINLISIDDVKKEHSTIINEIKKEQKNYFENNKKRNSFGGWRLSSSLMPTYNKFNERIIAAEKERTNQINLTNKSNQEQKQQAIIELEKATQKHKTLTAKQSNVLGYLVLIFEVGFLLAMWFLHWLDWKTYVLLLAMDSINDKPTTTPPTPKSEKGEQAPQNTVITSNNTSNTNQVKQHPYIIIEGYKDNVFNHQRIKNFLYAYKAKLKKWEVQKRKGGNVTTQSYNTIIGNIEKWAKYENQLLSKIIKETNKSIKT